MTKDVGSFSNEQLNTATNLIKKEAIKNTPRIDPLIVVRSMYNAANSRDAMKIGL